MDPTREALDKGKLTSLNASLVRGVVVMKGRAGDNLKNILGVRSIPVLMPETRLGRLIMIQTHKQDHKRDPRDAMSRSRRDAWIVSARQLAKSVIKSCPICRLNSTRLVTQLMGQIPSYMLYPCPPFTNTSLDFCGPFVVKGMGNSRVTHKCWGLVFVCLNTKATKLFASPGYSTDDFLTTYTKFVSNFGTPSQIILDLG